MFFYLSNSFCTHCQFICLDVCRIWSFQDASEKRETQRERESEQVSSESIILSARSARLSANVVYGDCKIFLSYCTFQCGFRDTIIILLCTKEREGEREQVINISMKFAFFFFICDCVASYAIKRLELCLRAFNSMCACVCVYSCMYIFTLVQTTVKLNLI